MGEIPLNPRHLSLNVMAKDKVLYDGHAVAAVAATSPHIAEEALKLIDQVIEEPVGGAHRDPVLVMRRVKDAITERLKALQSMDTDALVNQRYERLMAYGRPQ